MLTTFVDFGWSLTGWIRGRQPAIDVGDRQKFLCHVLSLINAMWGPRVQFISPRKESSQLFVRRACPKVPLQRGAHADTLPACSVLLEQYRANQPNDGGLIGEYADDI